MTKYLVALTVAFVSLACCFGSTPLWADSHTLDPELLRIGTGAGTGCAQGGCFGFDSDGNGIPDEVNLLGGGASSLSIFYLSQGQGHGTLVNPILLILGILNGPGSGSPPPTISSVESWNPYFGQAEGTGTAGSAVLGGPPLYGGSWAASGFGGQFTSSSTQGVYQFISLAFASPSQNFTNWSGAQSAINGLASDHYDIWVYKITVTNGLSPGGLVDVDFASPLLTGTYAIAYGCDALQASGACTNQDTYATPFTHAGLTQAPQMGKSGSLAALGLGLFSLGYIRRRQSRAAPRNTHLKSGERS